MPLDPRGPTGGSPGRLIRPASEFQKTETSKKNLKVQKYRTDSLFLFQVLKFNPVQ